MVLGLALFEVAAPVAHDFGPAAVSVVEGGDEVGEVGDVLFATDLGMQDFVRPIEVFEQYRERNPRSLSDFPFKAFAIAWHQALFDEEQNSVPFLRLELRVEIQ